MTWQFSGADDAGEFTGELTAATNRSATFRLEAPCEAKFDINGRLPQAFDLEELTTDLYVHWNKQPKLRGRLGTSAEKGDETSHTLSMTATDYRALLARRYVWTGGVSFSDIDTAEIAWSLIDRTQGQTGGNWGITKGLSPTIVETSQIWPADMLVIDAIADLAKLSPGFDWEIDANLQFNVYKSRGTTRDFVLDYTPTGGNCATFERAIDPTTYANAFSLKGATGLTIAVREASDLASRTEGRFEQFDTNTGLTSQTSVDLTADKKLSETETITPTYKLTAKPGVWTPDDLWIGDTCTYVIRSGRLNIQAQQRVIEITVNIDENGIATPDFTFGVVGGSEAFKQFLRGLPKRLRFLSRTS